MIQIDFFPENCMFVALVEDGHSKPLPSPSGHDRRTHRPHAASTVKEVRVGDVVEKAQEIGIAGHGLRSATIEADATAVVTEGIVLVAGAQQRSNVAARRPLQPAMEHLVDRAGIGPTVLRVPRGKQRVAIASVHFIVKQHVPRRRHNEHCAIHLIVRPVSRWAGIDTTVRKQRVGVCSVNIVERHARRKKPRIDHG